MRYRNISVGTSLNNYEYLRTKVQSFCIAAYIVGTDVSTKFSGRSFSNPMASEDFIAAPPENSMVLESKYCLET